MIASEIKARRVPTDPNQVRIILGGRATYAYLLEPQQDDPDDPNSNKSYKSGILYHKQCPAEVLTIIRQGILDAIKIGIAKKWGGTKPPILQLPQNDGDVKFAEDKDKYGAYKGMYYITAKKLEHLGKPILKCGGKLVTEPGIIEAGDWCAFDFNFYPFKNKAKGIAAALNAVTLIKEGERFGGGPTQDSIDEEANALYGGAIQMGMDGDAGGGDDLDDLLNMGGISSDVDDLLNSL